MKRGIVQLLLISMCGLWLTGCGSKKEEKVTLKVWESLEVQGYMEAAAEAYCKDHPNVTIEFENVEFDTSVSQIVLDGPAGAGADLFAAPCDRMGELVSGGYVVPVENAEEVEARVLPSCRKAATYADTMYGYPVSDETYALYYNKALISEEEVPKTWEEVISYTKENTQNGQYGFVMDPTTGYYTIIFTTANGNRLFGENGDDGTTTYLNTPEAISGLELLRDLSNAVGISSSDLNSSIADELFKNGKAAMEITGPWNASAFTEAGIDYGVTTLPCLPGEATPSVSFSGARLMFVSAFSEHQEEAAAFAEFLMSDEMQQMRYEYLTCIPSVEIEMEDETIAGFMEQLEYATPMPSIPQMNSFWESMGSATKNIWDGADVQSTMDNCDKAIVNSTAE